MKKSQLKNIIRESIKELINEQANQQPGYYNVDTCHCSHYDESTNSCSQPLNNYNYRLLKDGATSISGTSNLELNPQVGGMICLQSPQFPNVSGACPFTQQFRIVNITQGWNSSYGAVRNYRPEGCPSATTPDPVDPDPVDEDFVCYGCHPTLNQIATTITAFSSADENGVCGTVNFSSPGEDPSIVTFYDDVNHPQLEGCGADPVEEFGPCYGCVDNQITPQTGFTNSSNAGICGTVNGVTFYDDENHPQLEGCGAEGSFGTSGNYTVFDYPSGFDVTQWTASFIDMIINHPNPCNFLTQRITQFNNQLNAGVGPLQANQLMQKIAVCQELFQITGCGGMNEQISGVKKYKLDPKAAAVIRRMAPKLRGLASKGRGIKKESKKISALKRIIKEALSELQEAPKKCKCKNGVCKTAGGTLCPAYECDNKCKGVEDTVDKKNK